MDNFKQIWQGKKLLYILSEDTFMVFLKCVSYISELLSSLER